MASRHVSRHKRITGRRWLVGLAALCLSMFAACSGDASTQPSLSVGTAVSSDGVAPPTAASLSDCQYFWELNLTVCCDPAVLVRAPWDSSSASQADLVGIATSNGCTWSPGPPGPPGPPVGYEPYPPPTSPPPPLPPSPPPPPSAPSQPPYGGGGNPEGGIGGGGGLPGSGGGGGGCTSVFRAPLRGSGFDAGSQSDPCNAPRAYGQPPRVVSEVADYLAELGIPANVIEEVSWQEKLVCVQRAWQCGSVYVLAQLARTWSTAAATADPTGNEDGQRDGYRHVFWLGKITNAWDANSASIWGRAHEEGHPGTPRANNMDAANNILGMQLGSLGPFAMNQFENLILDADTQCRIVYYGPGKCPGR